MDAMLHWGLDAIRAVQQIQSPLLNTVLHTITSLGSGLIILAVVPLLLWCVDYRLGVRVMVLVSISGFINFFLKNLFAQPRPCELDATVGIATAMGYGLPSGHAQGSCVLWGSIAAWVEKRWFRTATAVTIVLIGFSRVYLGVHFPTDVLAGWIVGIILLLLYLRLHPAVERWVVSRPLGTHVLLSVALSVGLLLLNADTYMIRQAGMLCGTCIGAAVRSRYIVFSTKVSGTTCCVRYCIGLTVIGALLLLSIKISPGRQSDAYTVVQLLYALVMGGWMSLGAPGLFNILGLSRPGKETTTIKQVK